MSELAAEGIPVVVTSRVLRLARLPYYRWLADQTTGAEVAQAFRANALLDAHGDDPEFGYRFLSKMRATPASRCVSGPHGGWWSVFG